MASNNPWNLLIDKQDAISAARLALLPTAVKGSTRSAVPMDAIATVALDVDLGFHAWHEEEGL